MGLLANVEAGEPGRLLFYQSDLYQELTQIFSQVIIALTPDISSLTLRFRTDMLIVMLKSTSYESQRRQRKLTQEEILSELRKIFY